MTDNISSGYNKIYSENRSIFGTEPHPLVTKVLEYIKNGTAIEFGTGEGRNSLFLAAKGFRVVAVDISKVALKQINKIAKKERLNIDAKAADITTFDFPDFYDLIVCTFVFHHLPREQVIGFIEKIKKHTRPKGYHVITAFTKNGDFYRNHPATNNFYLDKNELHDIYKDWKTLVYFEKEGRAFAKHPDGTPMVNVSAGIIAKKHNRP